MSVIGDPGCQSVALFTHPKSFWFPFGFFCLLLQTGNTRLTCINQVVSSAGLREARATEDLQDLLIADPALVHVRHGRQRLAGSRGDASWISCSRRIGFTLIEVPSHLLEVPSRGNRRMSLSHCRLQRIDLNKFGAFNKLSLSCLSFRPPPHPNKGPSKPAYVGVP